MMSESVKETNVVVVITLAHSTFTTISIIGIVIMKIYLIHSR